MPRRLAMLLVAAALAPPPAQALAQPADEEQSIVVTGSRSVDEAVRAYVEHVTVETGEQIARFEEPVCPAAYGLLPEQNAFIVARLRLVADYLGIAAATDECRPNVVVIAADSGGGFMLRLHDERPALFSAFEAIDIRRIMQQPGPARAWHTTEIRGADGRRLERVEIGRERRARPALTGVMPSQTSRSTRQDLTLSFLVLDLDALENLTVLQIADYAAMRAFARTRPEGLPSGRSILTLFADRESGAVPAQELTEWDTAYLTGLYRTANVVRGGQQQSSIAGFMRRELESGSPGGH